MGNGRGLKDGVRFSGGGALGGRAWWVAGANKMADSSQGGPRERGKGRALGRGWSFKKGEGLQEAGLHGVRLWEGAVLWKGAWSDRATPSGHGNHRGDGRNRAQPHTSPIDTVLMQPSGQHITPGGRSHVTSHMGVAAMMSLSGHGHSPRAGEEGSVDSPKGGQGHTQWHHPCQGPAQCLLPKCLHEKNRVWSAVGVAKQVWLRGLELTTATACDWRSS